MNSIANTPRPLQMFWFLPTGGDGRYLGSKTGQRTVDHAYLTAIARAADTLGYTGVLIPTGRGCEDAWMVGATVAPMTERLKFLVALRPGMTLPAEAARQAATFDRMTNGRLLLNVVSGGTPVDLAGDGLKLGHDERYDQSAEFLQIFRGLMSGETVNFEGKYLFSKNGKLVFPPVQSPVSATLHRRLVGTGSRAGSRAMRRLSHLGRTPGRRGREDRRCPQAEPPRSAAPSASASGCTSSYARPRTPPGKLRTT